jgi:hypothetical protein
VPLPVTSEDTSAVCQLFAVNAPWVAMAAPKAGPGYVIALVQVLSETGLMLKSPPLCVADSWSVAPAVGTVSPCTVKRT